MEEQPIQADTGAQQVEEGAFKIEKVNEEEGGNNQQSNAQEETRVEESK